MNRIILLAQRLKDFGFSKEAIDLEYLDKYAAQQTLLFPEDSPTTEDLEIEQKELEIVPDSKDLSKTPRFDIRLVNLSQFPQEQEKERRELIIFLLDKRQTEEKVVIVNEVLSLPTDPEKYEEALRKYREQYPELRVKIPEYIPGQSQLPGLDPEIRFLPDPKQLEAERESVRKKWDEGDGAYQAAVKEFTEKNGRPPSSWETHSFPGQSYRKDKEEVSYSSRPYKPEEIEVDYNISPQKYKQMEDSLRKVYNLASDKREVLWSMVEQAKSVVAAKPQPKAVENFKTFRDMAQDLGDRLFYETQQIVLDSVGESIFGASTGRNERWNSRYDMVKDFFNSAEAERYGNPEEVKKFLSEAPSWQEVHGPYKSWGRIKTVDDWFDRKYEDMVMYNNSLDRATESYQRGLRFLDGFKKKIEKSIDTQISKNEAIINNVSKYHLGKVFEKYQQTVQAIEEQSDGAREYAKTGYAAGFFKAGRSDSYHRNEDKYSKEAIDKALDLFNIPKLIYGKNFQISIIENFIDVIMNIVHATSSEVLSNIIRPSLNEVSEEILEEFVVFSTGFRRDEFNQMKSQDHRLSEVANKWIATMGTPSMNYASIIKYPGFIFKDHLKEDLPVILSRRLGSCIYSVVTKDTFKHVVDETIERLVQNKKIKLEGPDHETIKYNILQKKDVVLKELVEKAKAINIFNENNAFKWSGEDIELPFEYKNLAKLVAKHGIPYFYPFTKFKENDMTNGTALVLDTLYNGDSGRRSRYHDDQYLSPIDMAIAKKMGDVLQKYQTAMIAANETFEFSDRREEEKKVELILSLPFLPETMEEYPQDFIQSEKERYYNILKPGDYHNFTTEDAENAFRDKFIERLNNNRIANDALREFLSTWPEAQKERRLLYTEKSYFDLFAKRMDVFGGVGPRNMAEKLKSVGTKPWAKGLPITKLVENQNLKTIEAINTLIDNNLGGETVGDPTLKLSKSLLGKKSEDLPNYLYAAMLISQNLEIRDPTKFNEIVALFDKTFREEVSDNIGNDEIKNFFPLIIKSDSGIESKLKLAIKFASFAHNNGEGLGKSFFIKMVQDPNFKDWGNVNLIDKYFQACAQLRRLGGYSNIMKVKYPQAKAMISRGLIPRGFGKRIAALVGLCGSAQRINPEISGFEDKKYLIESVLSDLNKIQEASAFSEYDSQVKEKDERLYKLDWAPTGQPFRFRVLRTYDPYHFQVGVDTGCCQKLNGLGADACKDSYVNPVAGVVLLEVKDKNNAWRTATQSYFHFVPRDNGYILDNVEYNIGMVNYLEDELKILLEDAYASWAKEKNTKLKTEYILVGKRLTKIDEDKFKSTNLSGGDPRDFIYKYNYMGATDWSSRSSIDLLSPKFKPTEFVKNKDIPATTQEPPPREGYLINRIVKLSNLFNKMGSADISLRLRSLIGN